MSREYDDHVPSNALGNAVHDTTSPPVSQIVRPLWRKASHGLHPDKREEEHLEETGR